MAVDKTHSNSFMRSCFRFCENLSSSEFMSCTDDYSLFYRHSEGKGGNTRPKCDGRWRRTFFLYVLEYLEKCSISHSISYHLLHVRKYFDFSIFKKDFSDWYKNCLRYVTTSEVLQVQFSWGMDQSYFLSNIFK